MGVGDVEDEEEEGAGVMVAVEEEEEDCVMGSSFCSWPMSSSPGRVMT